VLAVGISGAVDGNSLDSHLLAGAHDAAGDLSAVGNEDLLKGLERGKLTSIFLLFSFLFFFFLFFSFSRTLSPVGALTAVALVLAISMPSPEYWSCEGHKIPRRRRKI